MKRNTKLLLGLPLLVALGTSGATGGFRAGSSPIACASPAASLPVTKAPAEGLAAIDDGKIVLIGASGARSAFLPVEPGVLRHVSAGANGALAYVNDRKGADDLVIVREGAAQVLRGDGELTHPAISPRGEVAYAVDGASLRLRTPEGRVMTLTAPEGTIGIFSPLFEGSSSLMAVAQEPVEGAPPEGDTVNNLYRLDLGSQRWSRVTSFAGDAERWSLIRTPVRTADGRVQFVRVQGVASETKPPTFELFRLDGSVTTKVRDLPGEAFLAGTLDGRLVLNVYDQEWRLFREAGTGLEALGCGAVMVDPRSAADPDVGGEERPALDPAGKEAATTATAGAAETAIKVGDFATRAEAETVAARLGLPGLIVIEHASAPFAIAPGVYEVALPLAHDADVVRAIAAFQERFPEFAERSWVVSLTG